MAKGRTSHDYTIAIAYDGERTEDDYFRGWKLIIPPSRLTLIPKLVRSGGNPLKAVIQAERMFRGMTDVAEYWCVTDQDDSNEEQVAEAFRRAEAANIRLCLSTRCFEIWIALHFRRHDKAILNEDEAIHLVQAEIPEYNAKKKVAPFGRLYPLTAEAIKNSEWLQERKLQNPRTNVHALVRKLRSNIN